MRMRTRMRRCGAEGRGQRVVVGPAASRPGQVCEKIDLSLPASACLSSHGRPFGCECPGPGPVRVRVRIRGPVTVPFAVPRSTVPLPFPFPVGEFYSCSLTEKNNPGFLETRLGFYINKNANLRAHSIFTNFTLAVILRLIPLKGYI